jgi:tetratricopeptide (TPR) repeat protein
LLLAGACHGKLFGGRTTDEDKELRGYAESRQRAATYYDAGDYERAAAQYDQALSFRPDHVPTRLGYAYSLLATARPSNLVRAKEVFEAIGRQSDLKVEVKRVYGHALTCRGLAARYQKRAEIGRTEGRASEAREDDARSRAEATKAIALFERVLEIDAELDRQLKEDPKTRELSAVLRVSASLAADAHLGVAHCNILLVDWLHGKEAENAKRIETATSKLNDFATIAARARKFWELRREKTLMTDPAREEAVTGKAVMSPDERVRYEERIKNTIRQEVTVRRILLDTLLALNRFNEAIAQADLILSLDDSVDEVYKLRGNAYAWLNPPDYTRAVADLKAYRLRQDLSRLTDELVRLNQRIRDWEAKATGAEER